MKTWYRLIEFSLSLTMAAWTSLGEAKPLVFTAERPIALVELYTSEGCSSCPPADDWVADLARDRGLWARFVPVAFHVDYWNYLGWTDRWSDESFSERQRSYANAWRRKAARGEKSPGVFTPAVVVNGRAWDGWRRRGHFAPPRRAPQLTVTVDGDDLTVEVDRREAKTMRAFAAVLQNGIRSKIGGGENAGQTLAHEFVVTDLVSVDLKAAGEGACGQLKLPIGTKKWRPKERAIAVWLSELDDPAPVQAVGGWLP